MQVIAASSRRTLRNGYQGLPETPAPADNLPVEQVEILSNLNVTTDPQTGKESINYKALPMGRNLLKEEW
jgi:hypothetical protein